MLKLRTVTKYSSIL